MSKLKNYLLIQSCVVMALTALPTKAVSPEKSDYDVVKTRETITIDGKLDELSWKSAKAIPLKTMDRGESPFYRSEMKIIYDDEYIYFAIDFDETDLKGNFGFSQSRTAGEINTMMGEGWDYPETFVMRDESYSEIFLDPDRDGKDYLEFHLNILNRMFDSWYKTSLTNVSPSRFSAVDWQCRGIKSAVTASGTINNGNDIDQGWRAEVAIPFKSLQQFSKKPLPPRDNDQWNVLLVRVLDSDGFSNFFSYPTVGYVDCHTTHLYGKITFRDPFQKINRIWTFSERTDEPFFKQLQDLGITNVISKSLPSPESIILAKQYNIELVPLISLRSDFFPSDVEKDEQVQSATEREHLKALSGDNLYTVLEPSAKGIKPHEYTPNAQQLQLLEDSKPLIAKTLHGYQYGEIPEKMLFSGNRKAESLLESNLLCMESPRTMELLKAKLDEILARKDIKRIAFSDIGFRNYKSCNCVRCSALQKEYQKKVKATPWNLRGRIPKVQQTTVNQFVGVLITYLNSERSDVETVHFANIPFLPDMNFPAQLRFGQNIKVTAGYMRPDLMRIDQSAKQASRSSNIAFIGYADSQLNPDMPEKSPRRFELELLTVMNNGIDEIALGNIEDILNNSSIINVIKRMSK